MNDPVSCFDCDHNLECIPLNGEFPCPYPIFKECKSPWDDKEKK